eukprot:jgi/Psemu1/255736/estExt_Genewise1Plus.C_1530010
MAKTSTKRVKGGGAASAASAKGKGKKKDDAAESKKERKPRSETFVVCPYTGQKVWISKATLSDLKPTSKKSGNKTSIHKNDKKRLWTIASSQIRQDHYAEVAQALSIYEQNLLPSSGRRSWEVLVQLSEPNARVLFRSWKGQMELACLPHLIDRIPKPPVWPGKRNQPADDYRAMQGEEENSKQDYIKGLANREVSMLSQVAWDVLKPKYDHPAPTITIKWKSPDAKTFTSRKTAWEHATRLSKQEVAIDRNLLGIGASGKLLKEFFPTTKTTIEVGKMRFERDGLWVVGQETAWQGDREEELILQEEEEKEAAASKFYTSGLQLYVAENRHSYREEHATNLSQADKALRHQWRCMPPKEQELWNGKVQEQFEDDSSDEEEDESEEQEQEDNACDEDEDDSDESSVEYISHYQYFVRQRRKDYRHQQQMKLEAAAGNGDGNNTSSKKFTLAQADKELRQQWKEMNEEEQGEWIAKLKRMEDEEERNDDEAEKENDTESPLQTNSDSGRVKEENADVIRSSSLIYNERLDEEKKADDDDDDDDDLVDQNPPASTSMDTGLLGVHKIAESSSERVQSPDKIVSSTESKCTSRGQKSSKPRTQPKAVKNKKKSTRKTTSKYCLNPKQISQCHDACMEHYDTVMRTVKTRDLSRELADGFDVLRERGHGRFDMELPAFDAPDFDFLTNFKKTPWMPIVRAILGEDVVLIHKGCFMSLPGAGSQVYHQDGVHLTSQSQRPCHAINVFVPLVDLHSRNGPTEFVLGSHVLGHDGYDRDFLETPKPTAGTPVIFDYRLGHRGLANSSGSCRPIVYCTYARAVDGKEFRDSVNFSRKRYHKIGELSAKPLSREERRNKRKRSIESAREKEELERAMKDSSTSSVATEETSPTTPADSSDSTVT